MAATRTPRENRPSLRLLIAASRLRSGHPADEVARDLRIPPALVALIAEEQQRREDVEG
jgi:hypothetical protein